MILTIARYCPGEITLINAMCWKLFISTAKLQPTSSHFATWDNLIRYCVWNMSAGTLKVAVESFHTGSGVVFRVFACVGKF
jgi:hypothetical protein